MSNPINILVVEDSPTMRQLIGFALRKLPNMHITEANDGLDGLAKFQKAKFDLLVVDINIPIMDGIKLVDMIRKDEKNPSVPIIIVTTEGAAEDRDRAMKMGANAYITKPVQSGDVITAAKKLLGLG